MNDYDRHLEDRLRRMLDHIVNAPAPPRRRRDQHGKVVGFPVELVLVRGGLN